MTVSEVKKYIYENNLTIRILENLGMKNIYDNGKYISCSYPDGDNPKGCLVYLNTFLNVVSYTREIKGQFKNIDIIDLVNYMCNFNNIYLSIKKAQEICNINTEINHKVNKKPYGNEIFKAKKQSVTNSIVNEFEVQIYDNNINLLKCIKNNPKFLQVLIYENNIILKQKNVNEIDNRYPNNTKIYLLIDNNELSLIFEIDLKIMSTSLQQSLNIVDSIVDDEVKKIIFNTTMKLHFNTNTKIKISELDKIVLLMGKIVKCDMSFDKTILNCLESMPHIDLFHEGILPITCEYFDIKFDIKHNRIIFPHFSSFDKNQVLALIGRTVNSLYKELKIPKYLTTFGIGYKKNSNLYGLSHNYEEIKKNKQIIIFESEKSVLKAWQMGYRTCVSVGCHELSMEQFKILLSLQINEVIIAFDKDIGISHLLKIANFLKNYFKVSIIYDENLLLNDKDSPVDKGKKIFDVLYKYRKTIKDLERIKRLDNYEQI